MAPPSGLERRLGLDSATALVVGQVIGVGIFLTPADMARGLGSPFWLLAVWLVVGATALAGALCFGELAARYPESGGAYVYLREAWGRGAGFLYGWMCLLVMDPGLTAALAVGLADYASYLVPLSPTSAKAGAVGVIALLAVVNALGLRTSAALLRLLTVLKLGLLGFIVVWGLASGRGDWSHFRPFFEQRPGSAPLAAALAGGIVSAFFSFGGWWEAAKVAGEVRDPARVLPRALTLGVAVVTLVYVLTSAVFLYLVPPGSAESSAAFAARAGEVLFGRAGGASFAAIVCVSVLGSLAALLMAAPRLYYAMARDGLFLPAVAAVHPRFRTPVRAIAVQAGLAGLLVATGTFSGIVAYFVFVTLLFVALAAAAVYRLPRPVAPGYSLPGYPLTPLAFLGLLVLLLILVAEGNPRQAALGVAVVAAGAPVYLLQRTPKGAAFAVRQPLPED
jgi:APA family basic amino acid/polyamine antiporter